MGPGFESQRDHFKKLRRNLFGAFLFYNSAEAIYIKFCFLFFDPLPVCTLARHFLGKKLIERALIKIFIA
jgi:hypothetical protein